MDKSQLSAVVYKKTGVALGPNDPAFALVELNRLAFKEAIEETAGEIVERLNAFPERIQSSAKALAAEVGSQGVRRVVEMLQESQRTIASDTERAQQQIAEQSTKASETLLRQMATTHARQYPSHASAMPRRWLLVVVAVGIVSCTVGVVAGQLTATASLCQQHARR
jgi:hypothetical protein